MTNEEKTKYFSPVRTKLFDHLRTENSMVGLLHWDTYYGLKLDELLGMDEYANWARTRIQNGHRLPMPQKVKDLLLTLAGPHGGTIAKILAVKREVDIS